MIYMYTYIIITRLKCINSSLASVTYMRQWTGSALVQVMACCLFGAKPLSEPMPTYRNKLQWNSNKKLNFSFTKMHLKMLSGKWWPFFPGEDKLTHGNFYNKFWAVLIMYQHCVLWTRFHCHFSSRCSKQMTHSSPMLMSYGVCFMSCPMI